MQLINNLDELKQLQPKQKFWKIEDGHSRPYIFMGVSPVSEDIVVVIDDGNWNEAKCFTKTAFNYGRPIFVTGKYDSEFVGLIKIQQYKKQIEIVEEIYLKKTT